MVRVHSLGNIGLLFGKYHWQLAVKISDLSFSKFPPKNCPIVHFVGESSLRLHTFVSAPLSWGGYIASFGKLDLEKLSFECLYQVAETHSNSHMHLNTFLPFVYAVSMVSAAHIKNAENKNRVKLFHLQLKALMWVGMKIDTKSGHVILQIEHSFWF